MEIRKMLRHPFITKQEETRLPANVMEEFKKVLSWLINDIIMTINFFKNL